MWRQTCHRHTRADHRGRRIWPQKMAQASPNEGPQVTDADAGTPRPRTGHRAIRMPHHSATARHSGSRTCVAEHVAPFTGHPDGHQVSRSAGQCAPAETSAAPGDGFDHRREITDDDRVGQGRAQRRTGCRHRLRRGPVLPRVLDDLVPAARHVLDQYANNRVEADHGRLKARLRPMRGVKTMRSLCTIAAGHAFVQNRGHSEITVEVPAHDRVRVAFTDLAPCP